MITRQRLWTDAERAAYWKGSAEHYAAQVAEVQRALEVWRRDPEVCIRRIAKIVGYYIAGPVPQTPRKYRSDEVEA